CSRRSADMTAGCHRRKVRVAATPVSVTGQPLFYGKDGDLTGSDKESQEVSTLTLHLLQSALVHVNTLFLQDILSEEWQKRLTDADRGALSPLFWTHVNPYGRFEPDMNSHLALAATASIGPGPRTAPDTWATEPAAESAAGPAAS
ncbi:Tn3 family transposase, partial [Streptomyces erythrochromogenes]|uniref:Tn3 family transposase n=1 Tax=Streptomyces erythrochromogenes TaxID=285574 RepID=UPI00368109FA